VVFNRSATSAKVNSLSILVATPRSCRHRP
jgi:hypothetical protein